MLKSIIGLMTLLPALTMAAGNDLFIDQRRSDDSITEKKRITVPLSDALIGYNASSRSPVAFTFGTNLVLTNGVLNAPLTAGPKGDTGAAGANGQPGPAGANGRDGTNGSNGVSPALSIGSVSSGSTSSAMLTGTQSAPILNLVLQKGDAGATGAASTVPGPAGQDSTVPGPPGATGATGPAGSPAPTPTQSTASRALNTIYRVSTTRPAWVTYSVQLTVTATIAGGQNGDVVLEIASDAGFTTSVQTLSISGLGQVYSLAVAIQGVQPQTGVVSGFVPAGYYARLRTVNNTGAPTYLFRAGQETIL
uniref:Tail fiber protein n=4 Tax=unclassified bacterial viruses TaxID=12333 RepID=A0AAU6W2P1_9VIRU